MRILAFVLALLLLAGAVDPAQSWLIALVTVSGIAAFRLRPWHGFVPRPVLDVRMAAFVVAVLLLAGTVDANKDWLIVLSIVTGGAAFMPGALSLDVGGRPQRARRWREQWPSRSEWTSKSQGWAAEWEREQR